MKKDPAFLSVCMNPTLQKTLCFSKILPDKVNRTARHRLDASGKGINVSRVLTHLGKRVIHLTQLGGSLGPLFLDLCEKDGLDIRWAESGSAVRFCYTLIAGGEEQDRTVTELVEEGEPVAAGTEERMLELYDKLLEEAGTVIISGTKARGYSEAMVPEMTRRAREKDRRIILDVRGEDLKRSLPFRPNVIKPNLFEFADTFAPEFKELGELSGDEKGVRERITALALDMAERFGTDIVLSRGKRPVWYTAGPGGFAECPVDAVPPVNTIGSGDAFTAGLAAALDDGLPFGEAVARGVRCGGLNAGFLKPGVIRES
ncbi:MAG: PfkB family carbohydrate kinase [Treponema sp.]|jgi:1-phosphofructokinase/tagatose 6-phosphate kinase|nr:PfkB family carbohydrate kinase [Treponema sp.]